MNTRLTDPSVIISRNVEIVIKDPSELCLVFDQVGQQCAKTLCILLENVSKDQTVQYLLIMIDDMLEEDMKRVEIFREWTRKRKESVFAPFLNLLQRPDRFIVNMAARIVAKIAYSSKPRMEEPELTKYLTWLKEQLKLSVSGPCR